MHNMIIEDEREENKINQADTYDQGSSVQIQRYAMAQSMILNNFWNKHSYPLSSDASKTQGRSCRAYLDRKSVV